MKTCKIQTCEISRRYRKTIKRENKREVRNIEIAELKERKRSIENEHKEK